MLSVQKPEARLLHEALEMIEEMGGARALIDDLAEFERLQVRMSNEYETLLADHPDKWVAMGRSGTLAVGDSEEDVHRAVADLGHRRSDVVVEFLDTDPPVLIL